MKDRREPGRKEQSLGELREVIASLNTISPARLRERADEAICRRYMKALQAASNPPRSLHLPPSNDLEQRWQISRFSLLSKALALQLFLEQEAASSATIDYRRQE